MIRTKDMAEWASALLVFICGGMAGHYFALGMTPVQMAGAVTAILGSVTLAVAVRTWPAPAKAKARPRD